MEYVVIVVAVVMFLIGKGSYDSFQYKRKLREKLRTQFGTVSEEEYTEEKIKSIRRYFDTVKRPAHDVDDITWNDLELEELYMELNRTVSAVGEEYLYAMLRQPVFEKEQLAERERMIRFFQTEEEKRIELQQALFQIGKNNRMSVYACMSYMKEIKRESGGFHIASAAALAVAVVSAFLLPKIGVILTLVLAIFNMCTYMKRRSEMDVYLNTVTFLVRLLYATEDLTKLDIPELSQYTERMKHLNRNFTSFKRNFWIIGSKRPTGDIMEMAVSYIRMLFHIDLIKLNSMLKIYDKHEAELKELYEVAGYLDALQAVASFRALLGDDGYCIPELTESEAPVYEAEELYHPLLNEPVKNSIATSRSVLLTGSNASGKSTFLKSVAIGALLAQTLHTVPAKSYKGSYFQILSSMTLRDNMQDSESYFIVEIKSLKRIYEAAEAPVCTLCFVDEVLRGTNTVERIAASREVLAGLAESGRTICFAATHDIELTYLLETVCDNYHFEETVTEDTVNFDYRLHSGRATSRNAIQLLRMLGYPENITKRAEKAAEYFLKTGEWQ